MRRRISSQRARRGNATIVAILALLAIGGFAGIILSVSYRNSGETHSAVEQNRAFFAAQMGANAAIAELTVSMDAAQDPSLMGSSDAPIEFSGGRYWIEVSPEADDIFQILAHGRAGLQTRTIEVVIEASSSSGPFQSAMFAGNSSGDPGYVLELGGTGGQADWVTGNIYSGGSVDIQGDATVAGKVYATDGVSGAADSESGVTSPLPDLAAQNYALTADYKVADLFASATYKSSTLGGSAWQMPETSPAHIFRKNPSDRSANTSTTTKDDYFLEDPWESASGSSNYKVSLTGVNGKPGATSNQKVFYIDGNLWIHNYKTLSFQLQTGNGGTQVTFVVKGNIYISDDFTYANKEKDGVAFIAMKDSAVADSGNIYFGDPTFGTIEKMHGFMYAENNFHDLNLDASGSSNVELYGNMTAGNQIVINRDYTRTRRGVTTTAHTQLGLDFDDRLANGELDLPGIPGGMSQSGSALTVLSWREAGD